MADMTLEEALAASTVNSSTDSDILTISNDLRTITIPESIKNLGVESDEDVNRIHFKMPKMYKDVDLTDFDIRINYINGNDGDKYIVEDKTISEDYITFSWLVGRNALKTKGSTRFIVCLKKTDSEGIVQKEFNTTLASINVLEGLETTEQIMQKYPDVIEQILKKIEGSTTITPDQISEAVEEYMTANQIQAGATEEQAKQIEKNMQDISKLSADIANKEESGTAEVKVTAHNTSTDAHNDIRLLIQNLVNKVNTLLDSDDETLDQTSEIVAYIKSNKSLIDAITTSKVSVSDIIDNLTTNVANKPLSASQGVVLKGLIDALQTELEGIVIPTKLPNPNSLKIVYGGQEYDYDGSSAIEITIDAGKVDRIEKLSTDTTVELEPNKLYIFPEMAELTIAFAEPSDTGIVNEYHVVFQSGATETTLSLPDTVKLPSGFTINANKVYEISILEGCLCYQSWEVS